MTARRLYENSIQTVS